MKSLSSVFFFVLMILELSNVMAFPRIVAKDPFINLLPPIDSGVSCLDPHYHNQTMGDLFSPDFPAFYPNNANCSYFITLPLGKFVSVIFDVFETEECCDYIEIYDGVGRNNLIQKVSGAYPDGIMFTTNTSNIMEIVFFSDANTNYQGFHAVFDAVDNPLSAASQNSGFVEYQCGLNFTDTFGVVTSPNFPFNYPPMANCTYLIGNGKPNTQVILTIEKFETEACCDHLMIYDGTDDTSSPLIMDVSGEQVPKTNYNSDSNYMFMRFTTDANGQYAGYSIKYEIRASTHDSLPTQNPSFINVKANNIKG